MGISIPNCLAYSACNRCQPPNFIASGPTMRPIGVPPRSQQRGLHLFVLPPRSPKLNGAVERANRTHTEEFYQVTLCSLEMKKLNRELRQWERSIHRSPSPVARLPHPAAVPAAGLISKKGMKSVTHLLDEYTGLRSLTICVFIAGCRRSIAGRMRAANLHL